jgi:predicted nucleotidyltransferase component of viral defense system
MYPKYQRFNTDIDPTVDFVFPVNKIDRENSEKIVSYDKFEVNQMCSTHSEAFENFPKN